MIKIRLLNRECMETCDLYSKYLLMCSRLSNYVTGNHHSATG